MRMGRTLNQFILLGLAFGIMGCKRPMQNPELIDPIYMELLKESKTHDDVKKAKQAEMEAIKAEMKDADPRSGRGKTAKSRYYSKEKEFYFHQQMAVYYKLRARTRKYEARDSYLKAFSEGKAWPDPKEYEDYQAQVALRKGNRLWDVRVPKWSQRLKKYKEEQATESTSQASGGGGGH